MIYVLPPVPIGSPSRRSGATLLEVLVAIFVMGIGLLALLTLFPLGALMMAKAIQDDRCYQTGLMAGAVGVMRSVAQDQELLYPRPPNPMAVPPPVKMDPFLNPFDALTAGAAPPSAHPDYPSYPVYVDPIGWRAGGGTLSRQLCGTGNSYIARRSQSFVNTTQDAYQWFTLQDDIDFENGQPGVTLSPPGTPRLLLPVPPNNPTIFRDPKYSYGIMLQRPRYTVASVVDATIVVYNQRSVVPTINGTPPEYRYTNGANNVFDLGRNTVTIDYTNNVPPKARVGDWVLDATPIPLPGGFATAHAYFYRVVGLTDLGSNLMEYEVEQPIRGFTANSPGTVIFLEGVAEVYMKGCSR